MMGSLKLWFILLNLHLFLAISAEENHGVFLNEQQVLIVSTLNGGLAAVSQVTGKVLWTRQEHPVLDVPMDPTEYSPTMKLFPNPSDGTLYSLGGLNRDKLERLPLTIPELAHASPTQSSDGLLYTARKVDTWLVLDLLTGKKLYELSNDGLLSCPTTDYPGQVLHIARTAYTITVYDKESNTQKWNATYMEYVSNSYETYGASDMMHFCSSSDGKMVSMDRLTGHTAWETEFESPVVAVYSLEGGALRKIPITTAARGTLDRLTGSSVLALRTETFGIKATDSVFRSSLFIGFDQDQIYAMNAVVDEEEVKAEVQINGETREVPLIDGPSSFASVDSKSPLMEDGSDTDLMIIDAGHYGLPPDSEVAFEAIFEPKPADFKEFIRAAQARDTTPEKAKTQIKGNKSSMFQSIVESGPASVLLGPVGTIALSTVFASCIALFITWMTNKRQQFAANSNGSQHSQSSQGSTKSLNISTTDFSDGSSTRITSNGTVMVGKISYSQQDILGHGSGGTVVFKGEFDMRPVAVKRILPECFQLAEREVNLLRQSDQHPNVVRYFCMERDVSFCYIALELCQATLHEYVENWRFDKTGIDSVAVLLEAVKGLAYLHKNGIVHRDLKPRNVLLTYPNAHGEVRTKISDFGLCRKLPQGKVSFTGKSGVTGTEGWIAPELFEDRKRVTNAVDVFSMGCIIYYVLTAGKHPFGTSLRRQANIESGDNCLDGLSGPVKYTALDLVKNMISHNYLFRPSSHEVLSHCLFWSKERKLSFFQDVSDRIEKETPGSQVVQALEVGGQAVVKGDWRTHISEELREDLRRFRSYHGNSVRDLLRAMRNKKHHYRELPEEVRRSLGHVPDDFVDYFTTRFPQLLVHTYSRMQLCKNESVFKQYYHINL